MIFPNSFYVKTYGCSFNQSDSDKIKKILISNQFTLTSIRYAEFIIINTCAVKSQTQEKIIYKIKNINLNSKQKLIIAGCLPWISENVMNNIKSLNNNIIAIIDVNSYNKIIEVIKNYRNIKRKFIYNTVTKIDKGNLYPCINTLNSPGIIQIAEGCNGVCSFCCVRFARGTLKSYSPKSIINQIKFYLNSEIKEIYLTAQDTGIYKYQTYDLSDLLGLICLNFFGYKRVFFRLGMLNPGYLIKNLEKLLYILKRPLFFKFLHIPIQSASNRVLKNMRRNYSSEQIKRIFFKLRSKFNISISTDIICGFPGESKEDFGETKKFIQKYQPEIINISKFTPRPNTAAKRMKQLDSKIIKMRSRELTKIYNDYMVNKNRKFMNWVGNVLITKFNPNREYPYFARNCFYKPIVLKNGKINKITKVKIIETNSRFLTGRILDL